MLTMYLGLYFWCSSRHRRWSSLLSLDLWYTFSQVRCCLIMKVYSGSWCEIFWESQPHISWEDGMVIASLLGFLERNEPNKLTHWLIDYTSENLSWSYVYFFSTLKTSSTMWQGWVDCLIFLLLSSVWLSLPVSCSLLSMELHELVDCGLLGLSEFSIAFLRQITIGMRIVPT